MIRRSFRAGLALGVIAGLIFAVVKALGSRNNETAPPVGNAAPSAPWPKLEQDPTVAAAPRADLVRDPAAPRPAPRFAQPTVTRSVEPEPSTPEPSTPEPSASSTPTGPKTESLEPSPAEPAPIPEPAPAAAKAAPAKKAAATRPAAKKAPKAAAKKASAAKKAAKKTTKATKKAAARVWVEPSGGTCPTSHPVKAKLTSKIFHLPGMLNYDRTNPDRCYQDAPAAEADGLRAAKR